MNIYNNSFHFSYCFFFSQEKKPYCNNLSAAWTFQSNFLVHFADETYNVFIAIFDRNYF